MLRLIQTKYKNAAPKKQIHHPLLRDLSVGSYSSHSNFLKASAAFVAFNVNHTGSQLGVCPLEDSEYGHSIPILNAHSDLVTDFDFSPFEDGLLATCSADSTIKIWSLRPKEKDLSLLSPEVATSAGRRVETVGFHPVADCLVTYTSGQGFTLWDILANKELMRNECIHSDKIISTCWSGSGELLGTICKDKFVRLIDPRTTEVVATADGHKNDKDGRILWLGEGQYLLTSGFGGNRARQIFIRDMRKFSEPAAVHEFDSSTGLLLPLFDPDTNMLFLAGRGDSTISYYEFNPKFTNFLAEGYKYTGDQTKGACLVPKRALKVMEAEVNRVLQLTAYNLFAIPYYVPRKTYLDFHQDLFPDTKGTNTSGTAAGWMDGVQGVVKGQSLDPTKGSREEGQGFLGDGSLKVFKAPLSTRKIVEFTRLENDCGDNRKEVPEPRPRKKSLTPCSSSEEVGDVFVGAGKFFPIPKPRVSSNIVTSGLRTPSSFTSRLAADFSVKQDDDHNNGPSSLSRNGDYQNGNNGHMVDENGGGENGNDENNLSTSDRRKRFESSLSQEKESAGTNGSQLSPGARRVNVAERLRMYQQNADKDDDKSNNGHTETEGKGRLVSSNSNHALSGKEKDIQPAPTKPERKFTPPKIEPVKVAEAPVPKAAPTKRIDTVFGQVSKYRNFKVIPLHRKYHLENLRNISSTCPGESEAIQANPERVAVPLNTPGGKLAVFELSRPGRQPDGVIPALVHGSKVMDFQWDPFDNTRLAVGTDDGRLWLWHIPEEGLKEQTNTPDFTIPAHGEKIYLVKFHPLAANIMATASYDLSIRIWDLERREGLYHIPCTEQVQVLSMAWSPCGVFLATMAKDSKIRIYEPRSSEHPIAEGQGPSGVRSGRVCWVLEGQFLVVSGFERNSERQIQMYDVKDLKRVTTFPLDVSPSILIPFYDEDSSILFLYGRGDSTILAFDVTDAAPYLKQVNQHRLNGGHQGIAFLKKNAVDVQNVEFAKAYRLTDVAIEPLSFTVPRVKSEYFQDDLFPPTKVLWEATTCSELWRKGLNVEPRRVSLKPQSMKAGDIGAAFFKDKGTVYTSPIAKVLPSKPAAPPMSSKFPDHFDAQGERKAQQEQLEKAMKAKLEMNMSLEQDHMEGVDEEEWND